MSLHQRSAPISKSNLIDQLAVYLYAFGFVNDDEEIVDIHLPVTTEDGDEIPLTYTVRSGRQEVNIVKGGEGKT